MNNRKLRITAVQFEGSFVDPEFKKSWTQYSFKSGPRKGEFCGYEIIEDAKANKFRELAGTEVLASLINSVRLLNPEIGFNTCNPNHALLYIPTDSIGNTFDFAITFEEYEEHSPIVISGAIESVALNGFYLVEIEGSATDKEAREYAKSLTFFPPLQDFVYDGDADIYLAVFGVSEARVTDFLDQ